MPPITAVASGRCTSLPAEFDSAIGKTVTAELSRARDGSHSGLIRTITLPDGKQISLCPQNC